MKDPGDNRKTIIINLILMILVLVLIYALYIYTGGDFFGLIRLGTHSGDSDPINQLIASLRSFGQGLRDSFGGILR